jgi:hypothetical protein
MISLTKQASIQFSIGRGQIIYVDPYSAAVLGSSSQRARAFSLR